ncbi:MAG TPA: Asp-tRNA(Asn)/Glu-tRNA(Gln) amidotransferase subunit GatA [Nitrospirales bacterium]|nr:Asp-tRNA(Asn)/Glu-tRNA(Gln) amidotransferase subunit GatA [Nitrospirales bacterium]
MSLFKLTLKELQGKFTAGEISAVDIARSYSLRLSQVEPKIKAYITLTPKETLLQQAKAIDDGLKAWRKTQPLMGMPLGIKDNICTEGIRTTCGSRMLENFVPPYDATVMGRLRNHQPLILGKTNLDEFAMGSSTEHSAFGPSRNPWNQKFIPGGSSGGSAAAVAADECVAALGSDTGGSIRQPAACCGVVGLKPTYGRVSRFGLVAFASSLDQIGPITKTVTDAAILLNAIAGFDPMDSTSANRDCPDFTKAVKKKDIKKLIIGVPREYFSEGLDTEVYEKVQDAIQVLEELGGTIREVTLPSTERAIATYYLIATAEASSNLARYDGVRFGFRAKESRELAEMYRSTRSQGFGPEVKRRIMLGTYALSAGYYEAYYGKAQAVRTLIQQEFDAVFQEVDLLVSPVMPTPAFQLGERLDDPLQMYLSDIYTIPASLSGLPAISVPCGLSKMGLPIGLQLMGRPFEEAMVLRAAYAYEQATDWRMKRPVIRS